MNKYILLLLGLAVVAVHAVDGDTFPGGSTSSLQTSIRAARRSSLPTTGAERRSALKATANALRGATAERGNNSSISTAPEKSPARVAPTARSPFPASYLNQVLQTGAFWLIMYLINRRGTIPASRTSMEQDDYLLPLLTVGAFVFYSVSLNL